MLDTGKQNRSYLYGRLLAVYEKLEEDAIKSSSSGNENKRDTNAERLWTAYSKMPARTLKILEEKIRPYKERLKKNRTATSYYYESLTTNIMSILCETDNFEQEKNRALNEDFIFGYYAQRQELYKKKNKSNVDEENNYEEDVKNGCN